MPARHFEVADEEASPVTFDYRGVRYRCRGEAPALPVLRGMKARLNGELDNEAGIAVVLEVLEAVFEDGELDRLLKTGIGMAKLFDIAGRVMSIYNGEEPDDEGEVLPPPLGASTNSESSSSAST